MSNCCNFDWTKKTIKEQLVIKYGTTVGIGMLALFLCILTFILALTDHMKNQFKNTLNDETISNLKSLASDNSRMIERIFNKSTSAILFPYLYSTQISHESSFNLNDIPGYFDDGSNDFLANPLEYDSRYNTQVSFKASSWMLAYLTRTNMTNIPSTMVNHINKTMHSDEFIKPSYQNYKSEFVAIYTGFNDGLFMTYPGVGTQSTDPDRKYNPRARGWYKTAISTNDLIYTNPYKDFNGKGWMITMAKPVIINNVVQGVVGADMLISKINELISRVNISGSGRATLLDGDGNVVADRQWNPTPTSEGINYRALTDPIISDSIWNKIGSINSENLLDENGYFMYIKKIILPNNYFILILSIQKEIVFNQMDQIIDETNKWRAETIGIVTSVAVIVFLIVIGITVYFGYSLSKIIEDICHNTTEIMKRLGHDDMYGNVRPIHESNITEMNKITVGFNNMINNMRNGQEINKKNPFYNHGELFQIDTLQEENQQFAHNINMSQNVIFEDINDNNHNPLRHR
jgi:hypothetical protein